MVARTESIEALFLMSYCGLNCRYALAACGVAGDPVEGVAIAQEAQRAGKPGDVLSKWIEVSQREKSKEGLVN